MELTKGEKKKIEEEEKYRAELREQEEYRVNARDKLREEEKKKKKGIGCLVILLIIASPFIISALVTSSSLKNPPKDPDKTTVSTKTNAVVPKSKKWVTILEASGNGNKKTDTFTLHGGKARMTYNFGGGNSRIFADISVVKEGQNGGFADSEATVSKSGSDSTFLVKQPGDYYVSVTAGVDWTVKIEEER